MQICFIEDTEEYGGGQEWAFDTMKELIHQNHKINLVIPYNNTKFISKAEELGVNIYTYSWSNIPFDKQSYLGKWKIALQNSAVAVCSVHPPRDNFHCVGFAAECIKASGNKTALVPKTGTIVPTYKREYYLPDPKVKTRIITITRFTKNALIKNFEIPSYKIKTIYQGTNPEKFTPSEFVQKQNEELYGKKDHNIFTLGIVGKFEIRKGHIVLLEAIKKLLNVNRLKINVNFVGEGPTLENVKNTVSQLNLEDQVEFFPFTDTPQYFYDSIDVLVLPSLYKEGLPNVLLEAMLMEKPCIASKLAGTSEVIKKGKTGLLVDPGNSDDLADAILKFAKYKKEKLHRRGQNSRRFILENFDRKKQASKFLKYFEEITKKRAKTSQFELVLQYHQKYFKHSDKAFFHNALLSITGC